jgi:predicted transcriptional regulator
MSPTALTAAGKCANPLCSCSPCGCGDSCRCGIARLGQLERRVMDELWLRASSEPTVREIANALPDYAYTTVATVLDRLVHKGIVSRRKDGRAIRFSPVGGRDVHTALLMRQTLESAGDPMPALVQFARTLSPDEAEALRNALDDTQASEGGAAEPGS